MGGTFETSDGHPDPSLQPLRVPTRREELYGEAKDMVADLSGWKLERADDQALVLVCTRRGGMLGGDSTVTIRVEGPEGIPSATVHVRSETKGGLLARDRAVVQEFTRPFTRRVC